MFARILVVSCIAICSTVVAQTLPEPQLRDDLIIYEGPLAATVTLQRKFTGEKTIQKGTVLFITKDAVYFRRQGFGNVDIHDARKGEFVKLESADTKLVWTFDDRKKEIVGPTKTPRMPDIPASQPPGGVESKYLYFSLERLHQRGDQALLEGDEKLLKYLGQRAGAIVTHAKQKGDVPGPVTDLFESYATYLDRQKAIEIERSELLESQAKKVGELKYKERDAAIRAKVNELRASAEYLRGMFPQVEIDIWQGRWSRGGTRQRVRYDYGGAMAGYANMLAAQHEFYIEKNRLSYVKEVMDAEYAKKYTELDKRIVANRESRAKEVAKVGESVFGLTRDQQYLESQEVMSSLVQKNDFRPIIKLLDERIKRDAGKEKWGNPFSLHDLYHATSQLPAVDRAKKSDELFELAMSATEAVRLVPPGDIYNPDRAELLRSAAGLANLAAILEGREGAWADVYSPKAAYAVRVLERARTFDVLDDSGETREQYAISLLLSGRRVEALTTMEEIRENRKTSPTFQYNYARVLGANGKGKDGIAALEDAIALGFGDVKGLMANPDFIALRGDRFNALTKPKVGATFLWGRGPVGTPHNLELINQSPFTLVNVRLTLELTMRAGGKAKVFTHKIDRLRPNQQYDWKEITNEPQRLITNGHLTVETDQGKIGRFQLITR